MQKLWKPLVVVISLAPAARLLHALLTGGLGVNPAETLQLATGLWAFRFLIATLAVTPIRRLTGWNGIIRFRRMLGLFAFFYATLHVGTWIVLDHYFAWDEALADIAKRPFITAGMVAFASMVPLALTSTKGWIRRLGRRWQKLHRLIYASAIAAALHFVWKVKVPIGEPVYYAAVVAALLIFRVVWHVRADFRARVSQPSAR
jgi:methionine sulfoxide reductase heme-binding subunit